MSNKNANQNSIKVDEERVPAWWPVFCIFITIFLAGGVYWMLRPPAPSKLSTEGLEELQVMNNSLRTRLTKIIDALPADLADPNGGEPPRSLLVRTRDKALDETLAIAAKGRAAAQAGQPLVIDYIPDIHQTLGRGNSQFAPIRQQQITTYVAQAKPSLVFLEGNAPGELTSTSFYQQMGGRAAFSSIDEFRVWLKSPEQQGMAWWFALLDRADIQFAGVDSEALTGTVYLMDNLEQAFGGSLLPKDYCDQTGMTIAVEYRDYYVLGQVAQQMRERGVERAHLTLGALHMKTLLPLAKRWGITVNVAAWPPQGIDISDLE